MPAALQHHSLLEGPTMTYGSGRNSRLWDLRIGDLIGEVNPRP